MAIVFTCSCGTQLKTEDQNAGMQVRCPGCSTLLVVPAKPVVTAVSPVPVEAVAPEPRRRREEERGEQAPRRHEAEIAAASPTATSGKAIWALLLGVAALCGSSSVIGSFFPSWAGLLIMLGGTICSAALFGLPAIVLGFKSIGAINRSRGQLAGKGLAITGVTLGIIGTICSLLSCTCGSFFSGQDRIKESASRMTSANNLKQIGLAMANYDMTYNGIPAAIYSPDGKPLLSWRVAILPYIEEERLYSQFNLKEPWDSPQNKPLLAQMPKIYAAPGMHGKTDQTFYRVFHMKEIPIGHTGDLPPFVGRNPVTSRQLSQQRGMSNTILVVEAAESVPWTKPDELPFPVSGPAEAQLGGIFKDRYHVVFADGHVRLYAKGELTDQQLKAAISQTSEVPLPD